MAEIYDPGDLITSLRGRPPERGLIGTIASEPTFWSPGVFTYEVDIQDDISGTTFKVKRVRENVPWFYQSGGGLRQIGDRVFVNKLSRTVWEIAGDEITPERWDQEKPRVYLENHDEDRKVTSYIEVTRDLGIRMRGADTPQAYHFVRFNASDFRVVKNPPVGSLGYAVVRSEPLPEQIPVQVQNSAGHSHPAFINKADLGLDIARNIRYYGAERE